MKESITDQPDVASALPSWRRSLQDYVVDYVMRRVCPSRPSVRILDLGCGLGYTLARFSRLLPTEAGLVGIDVNREMVREARALVRRNSGKSKVQIRRIDASSTPFPDSYFDIVVANLSLSVFKRPDRVASETARILKRGGLIVATEVSKSSVLGKIGELFDSVTGHLYYTLYSPRGLVGLFKPFGMTVVTVSRIPLTVGLLGHSLRIPSRFSPVFLAALSKPRVSCDGGRVNWTRSSQYLTNCRHQNDTNECCT